MKLLQPGKISGMELRNRVIFAPMGYSLDDFGPKGHDYFVERAKGGAGLIIIPIFAAEAVELSGVSAVLDENTFDQFLKMPAAIFPVLSTRQPGASLNLSSSRQNRQRRYWS